MQELAWIIFLKSINTYNTVTCLKYIDEGEFTLKDCYTNIRGLILQFNGKLIKKIKNLKKKYQYETIKDIYSYNTLEDSENETNGKLLYPINQEIGEIGKIGESCIKDDCSLVSGSLAQGNYGNCWFNSALNALLLGEYSRILLLNKLKDYLLTNKIELTPESKDSCPLLNEKSIMEIVYRTLYLNNFNVDPDYLNSVRFKERIISSKIELLNPLKAYTINELTKKGIKSKNISLKTGGKHRIALETLLEKLNISYSSYSNKKENLHPDVLMLKNGYNKVIQKTIMIENVKYHLNHIAIKTKRFGITNTHSVVLVNCNNKLHYVNSHFNTPISDVIDFDESINLNEVKNKNIYTKNKASYYENPIIKVSIELLCYIRENNLKCVSFGKKHDTIEDDFKYLQKLKSC